MWRCCSRGSTTHESDMWRSTDCASEAPGMLFPMWILPISVFLTMSGLPKSHQELQDEGKLVQSGAHF